MPGHVWIASNIKNNRIAEAAGYSSGFGRFLEHPLHHRFARINTYTELRGAVEQGKELPSSRHSDKRCMNPSRYLFIN